MLNSDCILLPSFESENQENYDWRDLKKIYNLIDGHINYDTQSEGHKIFSLNDHVCKYM